MVCTRGRDGGRHSAGLAAGAAARNRPAAVLGPGHSAGAGAAGHRARFVATGLSDGDDEPAAASARQGPCARLATGAEKRCLRHRRGALCAGGFAAGAAAQPPRRGGGCRPLRRAGAGAGRRQRVQGPQRLVRHFLPLGARAAQLWPGAADRGAQRLLHAVCGLPEELLRLQSARSRVQRHLRRRPAPCRPAAAFHGPAARLGTGLFCAGPGTGIWHRAVPLDPGGRLLRVGRCLWPGGGFCASQPLPCSARFRRAGAVVVLLVCGAHHRRHCGHAGGATAINGLDVGVARRRLRAGRAAGRQWPLG